MRPRGAFYRLRFWTASALTGCIRLAVSWALAIAIVAFVVVLGSQIFVLVRDGDWRSVSTERILQLAGIEIPHGSLAASIPAALALFAGVALFFAVRRFLRRIERSRRDKARVGDREGIIDDMERALRVPRDG